MHAVFHYRWLVLFTLSYLLAAAGFYLSMGNWEFVAYLGVTLFVGLLILSTVKRSGLDRVALWGLSIWGLLHMMGGLIPVGDGVLYGWKIYPFFDGGGEFYILKMDQVIHFYGFGVSAVVMHQLIASRSNPGVNPLMLIFFAWVGAMGLGALNEVVEFLAFVGLDETGVGGVYNTGLDLIFNLCGAMTGAILQQVRDFRRPRKV